MRKIYEAISQVINEKKFVSSSKTQPVTTVDVKGEIPSNKALVPSSNAPRTTLPSTSVSSANRLPAVVQEPKITKIPTAPSAASRATSLAKGLATRGNIVTALALHHGSLNDNEDEDLAARRAADPNFKQAADKLSGPKDALSVIDRYNGLSKYVAQNKSNIAQASSKPSKPYKDSSGTEYDAMGNPSKAAKPAKQSPSKGTSDFGKAFAAARKDQGAGGEFEWNGKKYGTNLKGETNKAQASIAKPEAAASNETPRDRFQSQRDTNAAALNEPSKDDNEDVIKKQPAMSYAGGNLAKSKAKDPLDAVRPASSEDIETAKKKFKLDVVENRSVKSVYAAARSVMERHNIRNKPDQIDELVVPAARAAIAVAEPALVGAARFGASMLKNLFRNKPQQSSSKELTTTKPQTQTPGQSTAPKQLEAPKPSPSTAVTAPKPNTSVAAPKPNTSVAAPKPNTSVAAPKQLNVPKTKTEVKTQTQMAKIPPAVVVATTVKDPEPETKPELAKVPPSPPAPPSITSMGPRGDGPRKSEPQWQKIQPIPDWKDDKKDDSDNKPPMIHPTNVIPEPKPAPRPYITPVPQEVKPPADNKSDDDTPQANSVEVPKPSEAPEVKIPEPKAPEPVKAAPSVKPDWFVRTPGSPRKTADGKEEAGYLTSTPKKGEENATHDGTDIPKSAVYHGSGAAQHAAQIRGHDWSKVKEYSSNQMQTGIAGPAYKYDGKWHEGSPTSANMEMKKQKTVKEGIMSVNKKFGVSDSLYQSVMEVMKAKKQSSEPRNDKEEDLAKQYGDPKRITHGDILVARGVVKPNKVQEGTMRNGKYVDDAPRPGTNEVPSPDEGYRGAGKPLYTPVDGKKSGKKAQPGSTTKAIEEDLMRKLGNVAGAVEKKVSDTVSAVKKGVEDAKTEFNAGRAEASNREKTMASQTKPAVMGVPRDSSKETTSPRDTPAPGISKQDRSGYRDTTSTPDASKKDTGPAPSAKAQPTTQKSSGEKAADQYKNKSMKYESVGRSLARNALTRMVESDYGLDKKYKSPNMDVWTKPENEKFKKDYPSGGVAAYDDDIRGQKKYKERTSGGVINKIKDTLGVDKPDTAYGPRKESKDTPGNSYEHQCAIHVKSESFGEGRTITTQHADPDHDGNIAWYDVMFEHGIEKYVPTDELQILVSETHMHSKRKKTMSEDAATDRAENDARTEKTLAKMRQRNSEGKGFNVSSDEDPKPDAAAPAAATAPKGQAASSYAGARSVDAEPAGQEPAAAPATAPKGQAASSYAGARSVDAEPAQAAAPKPSAAGSMGAGANKGVPAQASATPRPAQSDAMSAIDGGSIGTSQSSFQTGPRDAKQGIAANAPAARVVSTSDGAKEAGYTQPNQRIAGFKSNARAREQAAGAAGVAAPLPGGNGKTIAQARQELGGKPVAGTPSAAVQNKPQGSAAPAPAGQSPREADFARRIADLKAKAQGAGIAPDRAQFTAGMKPGETRTASGSYNTATGERSFNQSSTGGNQQQASAVPPPAGESPEEKARKAAAQKKPAGSFQGQGMVGTDW